jgi:recombination associated protein RdgC
LLYRFTDALPWNDDALEPLLGNTPFQPCGSQDLARVGWIAPMPNGEMFQHQANGCTLLCLRKQQKILPGAVVAEALEEKIAALEKAQARKIYRKERKQLKEEITHDLLPRAFTRSSRTYAYIDKSPLDERSKSSNHGYLLVNSSSRNNAEELLTQLRNDVGSLPVEPVQTKNNIPLIMSEWLRSGQLPKNFALGDQCELRDSRESSNIVRVRGQDLRSEEVLQHLEAGKQVTRLELHWHEAVSCVLDEDLVIRRLGFTDALRERMDSPDDERAQFDQEFAVMTLELGKFLRDLLKALGGTAIQ